MARRANLRSGERGLSMIEALVIVTITALLALLLLPLLSRVSGRGFELAERGLSAAEQSVAERQLRTLLRSAIRPPDTEAWFEGRNGGVVFAAGLPEPVACASAGVASVRISVERDDEGGRLVCESASRRVELLHWPRGEAAFSFSEDGATWSTGWRALNPVAGADASETLTPPLVRFELTGPRSAAAVWVERVGWPETPAPPP